MHRPNPKIYCSTYQRCEELGKKKLRAGLPGAAIPYFELQAKFAELADMAEGRAELGTGKTASYTLAISAYNNLALTYLHEHDYLLARAWCKVALKQDTANKDALLNLAQAEKKLVRWRWPISPEGTYVRYTGWGRWDVFLVWADKKNKVGVMFSGAVMGLNPNYGPTAIGEFSADGLALAGRGITFQPNPKFPCTVRMDFLQDKVTLAQVDDCGFGNGVSATGSFEQDKHITVAIFLGLEMLPELDFPLIKFSTPRTMPAE